MGLGLKYSLFWGISITHGDYGLKSIGTLVELLIKSAPANKIDFTVN